MGACIGKPNSHKQLRQSYNCENNLLQRDLSSKEPSILIPHQIEDPRTFKKDKQTSFEPNQNDSQNKGQKNQQINSHCTLDNLLGQGQNKQNMDDNAWSQSYSTRSSIIRIPKKHNKKKTKDQQPQEKCTNDQAFKQCMRNLSQNQNLTVEAQDDPLFIRLCFQATDCSDIQFMLPKCRAGPLVVPYINYDTYILQ